MNTRLVMMLVLALGLLLAFSLQWMLIAGVTYLAGGLLVFEDPGWTLLTEFAIAAGAGAVAVYSLVILMRLYRRLR